ncbi:conserved hypothetical protein [Paecilomyces variotii No. 5]|uniref:Uncharacterized protein n=1 Tax=Byssochlamys spectabilis (strain No. 5 / NBRC 109023) TaxID=1356009 RepID=V5FIB9_BYSSN|nr:conserved hypothetical protein [Paecilomyces variotii No. 5]
MSNQDSIAAQNAAGASGTDDGSSGLSTTALAILITIVGVVVILGVTSAFLYLIAKRRQWRVREKIRRSARRVGEAIRTPLTPRFAKSARSPLPQSANRDRKAGFRDKASSSLAPVKEEGHQEQRFKSTKRSNTGTGAVRTEIYSKNKSGRDLDVEKGLELQPIKATSVVITAADSNSVDNGSVPVRKGWGSMFSFGRQ